MSTTILLVPECVDQCLYLVELGWNADLATESNDPVPECVDQCLYLVELCWNADLATESNDPVPECVDQCLYLVELCWNADLANENKAWLPSRRKIHALNKKKTYFTVSFMALLTVLPYLMIHQSTVARYNMRLRI